jgi:transcriptional regulator GlxA family with amidase domain
VRGRSDYDLHVERGLEATADADLVCLAPKYEFTRSDPAVLEAVQAAHDRGAIVYAHCSAVFELGAAGLLEGRECTTHWRFTELLQRTYPTARVCPDVLYCHDGNVLTGAGSAAGIDASLHLLREQFGAKVAAATARRIVVPPHRDGGQAQFIARAVPDCDAETLGPLLQWIVENLGEDLGVDALARRSHMSPRTFARRFRAETGTTPHSWVTRQRVQAAEELLERTDHSIDWIADEVGFGNAATLRHHFARVRGLSPQQYRRRFAG